MTLEENIQQLRDSLTVTSAQTLRHETRLKEHQQWLEDCERVLGRILVAQQEADENITRVAAAHLLNEEASADLREGLADLKKTVQRFIDALQRGGNGHQ